MHYVNRVASLLDGTDMEASGAILYLVVSIALSLLAVAGGFFLITKYN